ncbi:MAG: AMP-binding enzyme [Actinoallomurus sp.]
MEPAEIEAALEAHEAITRAAVVARSRPGEADKVLCAYVVCADGTVPGDVSGHLAARVPKHLVPPVVLAVPKLPLAPSGKIDTRGLPDPFATTGTGSTGTAATADPVQAAIAGIWAGLLGTSAQDLRHDSDFYSLGGTSLTLVVMVAEVCEQVVPPEAREGFMARLVEIISEPTLHRITSFAAEASREP